MNSNKKWAMDREKRGEEEYEEMKIEESEVESQKIFGTNTWNVCWNSKLWN